MKIQRCKSLECSRPFQVNEFAGGAALQRHAGKIPCPHCGAVVTGCPDIFYLTHAMSSKDELIFEVRDFPLSTESGADAPGIPADPVLEDYRANA
jgi:hypothetical protein